MDPRTRMLLTAPIVSSLLQLAVPNLVVMLVQSSIGLLETYFIAKLGTDALAAMALVFPPLMLVQMISAGAMGGGILTAVARTLGRGQTGNASALVWQAVWVAIGFGALTSLLFLTLGPALYAAMGGAGAALRGAETYAGVVFGGAVLIWLYNSLAAVIRGTGNMTLPAAVTGIGAILLIPVSPALIFGWGPFPRLGIVGGGVAVMVYYFVGSAVFVRELWGHRGVLRPAARPARPSIPVLWEISRIGALSSIISASTNVTIAVATGFAGKAGEAAVAGYGTGVRLEYLLVPLVFGLGTPVGAMVGTSIGAGETRRAARATMAGAAIAGVATGTVGLLAALRPEAWLTLFGKDPAMIAAGAAYLHRVGPTYWLFGVALAIYFAAQGAGRLRWPLVAAAARTTISIGGGALAIRAGYGIDGVFLALACGLAATGLVSVAALLAGGIVAAPRRDAARRGAATASEARG